MSKNVLALGPYIGDFKNEILNFRPHMCWIYNALELAHSYISTHSNRLFLYNFIKEDNKVPVYSYISRDEVNQKGYVFKPIIQKDYNFILNEFKAKIVEKESCVKKNIKVHKLNYIKSSPSCSIYKKIFEKIPIPDDVEVEKGLKVFIPDIVEDKYFMKEMYSYLKERGFIIIGDTKTHLNGDNVILSDIDYFENGYKKIIKYISQAEVVVCPTGHWTVIANLQKVPVFSWGYSVGQYGKGGIYYFNNSKSMTLATNKDTKVNKIVHMVDYFLERS